MLKRFVLFFLIFGPFEFCMADEHLPPLTLDIALVETLKNQKEIQISYFDITNRRGILQQSAGPFDPTLTEDVTELLGNTISTKFLDPLINPHGKSHFKVQNFLAQANLT